MQVSIISRNAMLCKICGPQGLVKIGSLPALPLGRSFRVAFFISLRHSSTTSPLNWNPEQAMLSLKYTPELDGFGPYVRTPDSGPRYGQAAADLGKLRGVGRWEVLGSLLPVMSIRFSTTISESCLSSRLHQCLQ